VTNAACTASTGSGDRTHTGKALGRSAVATHQFWLETGANGPGLEDHNVALQQRGAQLIVSSRAGRAGVQDDPAAHHPHGRAHIHHPGHGRRSGSDYGCIHKLLTTVREDDTNTILTMILKNRAITEPGEVGSAWYVPDMLGVVEG
jgi:hypothetical protein